LQNSSYLQNNIAVPTSNILDEAFWIGLRFPTVGSTWQLASSGEEALYIPWDESQPN
jgi:hypothetical protein